MYCAITEHTCVHSETIGKRHTFLFYHNYNYYYRNKNILVWYSQVDDSPDSDEEVIDVEETLAKLQDVSKLFDEKNNQYNVLDNESVLIKQVNYSWYF